jgi:hypothetical protein
MARPPTAARKRDAHALAEGPAHPAAWRKAVYWLASIAALALVVWDIADKGAQYTSIVVIALVVIATVALRAPTRSGRARRLTR